MLRAENKTVQKYRLSSIQRGFKTYSKIAVKKEPAADAELLMARNP
jgi:hypothetical protein